ncbi:hypothetical protein [Prochlorococcus marinus]|uniref:hypothetical protein n=1 Tax=Prochlorococcus marinus TaxID=1219 RepID=UPI0022B508C8|nr:hypothetical protein [Prochlorococcus marinus]
MESFNQFRKILLNIEADQLGALCEEFLYDHEGAIQSTLTLVSRANLKVSSNDAKVYLTEMHEKGDFDDVNCFSTPLYQNDLYKKFHPDKLTTAKK